MSYCKLGPAYLMYIFFYCLLFQNVNAYQLPVGIPNVPINFEKTPPVRPDSWEINTPVEVPGYYYVKYKTGSDNNVYGTPLNPRRSIPYPVPPGSYIEIAGEYSYASGGVLKIKSLGTTDEWVANSKGPVWITKAKNEDGFFTNYKAVIFGSNLFLFDMKVHNNSKIQVGSLTEGFAASNIVIKNNDIAGTVTMGTGASLSAVGHINSPTKNIIFYKNVVHDLGDIYTEKDIDAGCITASGYVSYVWILDNKGFNAAGPGLQINAGPPNNASHHIFAGHNEFYNVRQSGMWVKFASDVVFSSNYVHDIISTSWSPAKGMGAQYEPNGLWMINNEIHDVEFGIRIPSTYKVENTSLKIYAIGNVIYNVRTEGSLSGTSAWDYAGIHLQGADERYIYNNFIYNTPNGINISSTSGKSFIQNNFIVKVDSSHPDNQQGYHIWAEYNDSQPGLVLSNNFFNIDEMDVRLINKNFTTTHNLDLHLNSKGSSDISANFSGFIDIDQIGLEKILSIGINDNQLLDLGYNVYPALSKIFSQKFGDEMKLELDFLGQPRLMGVSVDISPFEINGSPQILLSQGNLIM